MSIQHISIIGGTGDQGKGLALRWAKAGYKITIGSRDAERASASAAEMVGLLGGHGEIDGAANPDAAAKGSVIVVTVPFAAQIRTLKDIRESIAPGSILMDVTVPLEPAVGGRPSRMLGVWAGSAAEQCAELAPAGVSVVSGFHNVSASVLADLEHDVDCDIIVCGDDKTAKETVRPLITSIPGCRYIDGGVLANSRTVEAMTALLIGINIRYKTHSGIRVTGITEK